MIEDEAVEKAADWLISNAPEAGRLRGDRVHAEEYRKSLKAILASQSPETDEVNRARRVSAQMRIEIWRTQNANNRSVKL